MQNKHFTITNAMRADVANKLTLQAVSQHGPVSYTHLTLPTTPYV